MLSYFSNSLNHYVVDEIKYAIQVYLFWTFTHNLSIYLYKRFCMPESFLSYLFSPILAITPQCKGLFFILENSTSAMNKMVIGLSMWVIPKLTYMQSFYKQAKKEHNE